MNEESRVVQICATFFSNDVIERDFIVQLSTNNDGTGKLTRINVHFSGLFSYFHCKMVEAG